MKNYIVVGDKKNDVMNIAAKELRRYLYVLGEGTAEITELLSEENNCMVLAEEGSPLLKEYEQVLDYSDLNEEGYILYSKGLSKKIIFTGKTSKAVLYAVYHFLELQGIQFCLHGDIIPDYKNSTDMWNMELEIKLNPIFKERGIQPFHDFPEGPDWWNEDDYFALLTQLPKMRANFFALHTYPENKRAPEAMTAEPLVWIGKKADCNEDGSVKASYPVQHFKTNGNSWGYHPMKTGDYPCGTGNIFEKDDFGANYMEGYEADIYAHELHRDDVPADKYNQMFNAYGQLLSNTFSYAKRMGIKTCIGTEAPLTVPKAVKNHLEIQGEADKNTIEELYEGIFERIKRTHPLDYFWMWTPEDWTWLGNTIEDTEKTIQDFSCALKAKEKTSAPFELAVCGWTLGPQEDRAAFDKYLPKSMPFSCINRNVGFDPVEPTFNELENRPSWAIPWLEDDPAMVSPQLWVGRMRRDAFDAERYGCDGLLGIHWRTRNIAPNIKALMDAGWSQEWKDGLSEEAVLEGYSDEDSFVVDYPDYDGVLSSARKGMSEYTLKIPAGTYHIKLVFQHEKALMDIQFKNTWMRNIELNEEKWEVEAQNIVVEQDTQLTVKLDVKEGQPALAAIEITGARKNNQLSGNGYSRKINCGGSQYQEYEADLQLYEREGRYAPVLDFYERYAVSEFGEQAGKKAAVIFSKMDGHLPRPTRWEDGPGNVYCNEVSWEDMKIQYDFADEFAALESEVEGRGNKARFDYWNHTFQAMKNTAQFGCNWGEFSKNYAPENAEKLYEIYERLLQVAEELDYHLLMSTETCGDMGALTNLQQRTIVPVIEDCKKKLGQWFADLPELKSEVVEKAAKLVVPTVRTSLQNGENLNLKAIVIGGSENTPVLYYRNMGEKDYTKIPFVHEQRWVYKLQIPSAELQTDFEYHISLEDNEKSLRFPNNNLHEDQTVIVLE